MTSALTSSSSGVKPSLPIGRPKPVRSPAQEPTPPHHVKNEDDEDRGRSRSRSEDDKDVDGFDLEDGADVDADGHLANSSNSDGPVRKRRRSRKGLDKKFECPQTGCGKSYSRAEHLYRHQLNHNPKQVYRCNIKDCTRTFVRLDLCNRHKDRHTAKGSALNRKDSMMSQISPVGDGRSTLASAGSASPEANRPGTSYVTPHYGPMPYSPRDTTGSPYTPITGTLPLGYSNSAHAGGVEYMRHDQVYHRQPPNPSPTAPPKPSIRTSAGPLGVLSPVPAQVGHQGQSVNTRQSSATIPYPSPQNFPRFSLPHSDFGAPAMTSIDREGQCYAPAHPNDDAEDARQPSELALPEAMSTTATIPVFGTDSILDGSPRVGMPEDFMAYLFNTQQGEGISMAGMAMPTYKSVPILPKTPSSLLTAGSYGEVSHNSYNKPSGGEGDYRPQPTVVSVLSLLDQNPHEAIVSDEKSLEIFDFIKERFHDNGRAPVERLRDAILNGDRSQDTHMLSRTMMQAYIISYWVKFSDQVPIQHKPTFCPAKTERLLLIAMMTIGAACLDKAHGKQVTKAGAQLSNFLAWNLRLEIFKDPAFRPPAKLWVFQALLLLELYEKMYSTRDHHEYAHLFHATTITLMRRGRALIGKSPPDSPPRPDKGRSRHSSDEWWNDWITNEATRRVAFTAFIIDSIHGTMFGHSAMMAAHEMRLPLPCDDKLWKATSSAEVGRFEANAMSGSSRPISFLEGIKQTLGGTPVVTNSFGRTVLMAGLLSVGWHMNQRDLQINSLGNGISEALGGRDRWRSIMIRAFDTWKNDFDDSLLQRESQTYPRHSAERGEANHVFESCMVLHHLAHMAMHVDIVDCQIFARAKRLLGRAIGPQDLASVQRRMKDWAPTAKARDAAFYALKFLASVLLHPAKTRNNSFGGGFGGGFDGGFDGGEVYSARDDVLLNRAWVLYFAALVVWCYGFALEGPDADARAAKSPRDNLVAMREYLSQYSAINTPDVLRQMKGVNRNTPVLLVLQGSFEESRWELLNEGAILLRNCLSLNRGDHL